MTRDQAPHIRGQVARQQASGIMHQLSGIKLAQGIMFMAGPQTPGIMPEGIGRRAENGSTGRKSRVETEEGPG